MPTEKSRSTTVMTAERNTGGWRGILSLLFARGPVSAAVTTRVHFEVSPERAWNLIVFYEEVPGNPPFPLRAFMPHPIQTEGNKDRTGSRVRCIYAGGSLVKRITEIQGAMVDRIRGHRATSRNRGVCSGSGRFVRDRPER